MTAFVGSLFVPGQNLVGPEEPMLISCLQGALFAARRVLGAGVLLSGASPGLPDKRESEHR
jgi:hypothetical protein